MAQRTCKEDDCDRSAYCRGWCNRHYRRWRRHGDPRVNLNLRPQRQCSVDGCDNPAHCHGWCEKHYTRWRRHGDPLVKLNLWGAPEDERFWAIVDKAGPEHPELGRCWLWTGSRTWGGYGVSNSSRLRTAAHRVAYEYLVGPIPEGMELDHLCDHKCCVNPAHLEPVTHLENLRRAKLPRSAQAAKTHCPQGHPYDAENTYVWSGKRSCRSCSRERTRACRLRRRSGEKLVRAESVNRLIVFERDAGICGICGEPVDPAAWHLDHVVPRSKGGPHSYANVQVAHPRCNVRKQAKLLAA